MTRTPALPHPLVAPTGKAIQKGVATGVIPLTLVGHHGGNGGKHDKEVQRFRLGGPINRQTAEDFGGQHPLEGVRVFAQDKRIADYAGSIDHAVQFGISGFNRGNGGVDLIHIGDIGAVINRLATIATQPLQPFGDFRGFSAAAQQDHGSRTLGQNTLSHLPTQATAAAHNQVNAVAANAGMGDGLLRRGGGYDLLHQTLLLPIANGPLRGRGQGHFFYKNGL